MNAGLPGLAVVMSPWPIQPTAVAVVSVRSSEAVTRARETDQFSYTTSSASWPPRFSWRSARSKVNDLTSLSTVAMWSLPSSFGQRARTARWSLTTSCRKNHWPDFTSANSAVHFDPPAGFQFVIGRPPLITTVSPDAAA